MSLSIAMPAPAARPWRRALLWLAGLAPFFYLSYGAANWAAAQRIDVPAIVFDWERDIPFLAWTIFPYWSINLLYGLSLLLCRTRRELDVHGRRLLTAQIVAVVCFFVVPLRFSWAKPEVTGVAGFMFDTLASFDQPFNQAPSLHIALLVILWPFYVDRVAPALRWPLHAWFALIGVSVLTTWQHHFIDLPTGALLGLLCLWVWPDTGSGPLTGMAFTRDPRRRRFAARYLAAAIALAAAAVLLGGTALWLLWPAAALLLVACVYAALGLAALQKGRDGRVSLASILLLAPFRAGAWINARAWTWSQPDDSQVASEVALGRFPTAGDLHRAGYGAVVDLAAEFPAPRCGIDWTAIPLLDRATPDPSRLAEAADAIERARRQGRVLVCCALGYARSAAAVATWLAMTGRSDSVDAAMATLRAARPGVVLDADDRAAIAEAVGLLRRSAP